jgi:DNA-binding beta-propeller fold protein YncE
MGEIDSRCSGRRWRWRAGKAALVALAACSCAGAPTASALSSSFGTGGAGAGQISNPQGIAIDQESGDVFVSDRDNNRIDEFDAEGKFVRAWGWGVADGESEEQQSCTSRCFKGLKGAGAGEFDENEGIAVDNDPLSLSHGDVYVVDAGNLRVQKFSPDGKFLTMFGGEVNAGTSGDICPASEAAFCKAGVEGTLPGRFEGLTARSIAVDAATATVYVGDRNRVQRFSEEGAAESEVTFSGVGRVRNLALDSAKDIYIWGGLQEGVHKYDPVGVELPPVRDPAGFGEGLAIAVGPGDELFVNDFTGVFIHHILTFNAEGEQTASFDRGGQGENGQRGIAYSDFAKALYVLNGGAVRIVTPPPPGPLVVSESASEIEPTSAALEATVNPEGDSTTSCRFEYGTSIAYGQSTPDAELKGGEFEDQPIGAAIDNLQPSAEYHFRAVCENAAKELTLGPDRIFTTLPPVSIDQTSASEVDDQSARLEAELNPHGLPSEYHFEYDTTPYAQGEAHHGISTPIPDAGAGEASTDTTVANLIQELTPAMTYHYRVVAHNALGTVTGPDRSLTTQGPAAVLPDGRVWELVSPANKHGAPLEPLMEAGGMIQAAAGGGAFAYVALAPIDEEPAGNRSPVNTQLLARRDPSMGWRTQDIATPHEEISEIHVGSPSEYKFFAEDMSASAVEPEGVTPLSPQTSERTPYRREADGEFVPFVSAANVPPGTKFGGEETTPGGGQWGHGVEFLTATPDLGHVVLDSPQVLAAGFKPGFEANGASSLYELTGGSLTLVSVLPGGEAAAEAGSSASVARKDESMRGAISSDGGRVVFEAAAAGARHLYLRDTARGQTLQLDERLPGAAGGAGEPEFQAAGDGDARVLFTDASQLTPDSTAGGEPDLYMCEVEVKAGKLACALSDLSVDPNPGEAADVHRVSAIDASAEHVYFAANGVLTSASNARGEVAVAGTCNSEGEANCDLYEYDTAIRRISLVAVLSSHDDPDWAGSTNLSVLGNLTARSSPDGRYYAFMSRRSLTGYDNRDVRSGQADEEVFLFDSASGKLECVSCDPSGARPLGVFDPSTKVVPGLLTDHARSWRERWLAASIPGWTLRSLTTALYQSRYLSNSGRMFFNATDALVPQDTNNASDVYQFEPVGTGDCSAANGAFSQSSGGCVSLISSGSSKEESAFLDASESGDEAFFLSAARLVGSDVDGALDVYDAHVCSSSSPCPPPPPPPAAACEGDSCQNPSPPPNDSTPSSLTYTGPENPLPASTPPKKAKAKPTKAQLLARALRACKKKRPKQKRLACERQARRRYAAKRTSRHKGKKASRAGKGSGGR